MNIKEAIEYVKYQIETGNLIRGYTDIYLFADEVMAVLAELEKKDKEIERYKMMLAETHANFLNSDLETKRKNDEDLEMLNNGWKLELEKKDKIINLMAEELANYKHEEIICMEVDCEHIELQNEGKCIGDKQCIINYYEREVKEDK